MRSIHGAWERGDYSSAEWAHPHIELVFTGGWPDDQSRTGLAEAAEGWRQWLSVWQDFRVEAEEIREIDNEHVLVLGRFRGRGKTSGLDVAEMRTEPASLFEIRDGKVGRLVLYYDRERAYSDLGLAPEGDGR